MTPTDTELRVLALTAELHTARAQLLLEAGFPADLSRDPTPVEVASRTTFAGIEDDVRAAAGRIAALALSMRADTLDLLAVQLAARAGGGPAAVLGYLDGLAAALATLPGAEDVIGASLPALRAELDALALRAAGRALADAASAGSPVVPPDAARIDDTVAALQARRVAAEAVAAGLRAARGAAYSTPRAGVDGPAFVRATMAGAREVGTKGLEDVASQAAIGGSGAGRNAAMDALEETDPGLVLYASELLDRNTCTPCSHVDGKRYASMAEAEVDYPDGRYAECKGGDRCRGTLISVHEDETPATLQRPLTRSRARRAARVGS